MDCFGINVSSDEIRRWTELTGRAPIPDWALKPYDERSSLWRRMAKHFLRHHLPVPAVDLDEKRVMELGCGMGQNAGILLGRVGKYVGLDISVSCVAMARFAFARETRASFLHTVHDLGEIMHLRGVVDLVFGRYFFIHQPPERVRPMMEFAHTMLRPGGLLAIDRQIRQFPWKLNPDEEWVPGSGWWGFVHEREWLDWQLRDAGFDDVRFLPSGLHVRSLDSDAVLELVTARRL